jgi:hypothetical protein
MRVLLIIVVVALLAACDSEPRQAPAPVLMHDHTPHHGGVVTMVGMIHLEAVAEADGRLQVYLTDRWRKPLPLADVSGTVTLHLPGARRTLPLLAGAEALEAAGPAFERDVVAAVTLQRAGQAIEANFSLPIRGGTGAAGIPTDACMPVARGGTEPVPRCTLRFAKAIVALTAAPDARSLLIAVVDNGVSVWRLPAVTFALGFAAAPAVPMPAPEPPHPEAPNAVIVRPDGREVALALENRLVIYAADTGQVLRSFNGPGGVLRAAAWSPDGGALLVTAFYQPAAYLLDAADGRERRRYPVTREGAAVAFAAGGTRIAVGSELGTVSLFAIDSTAPLRVIEAGGRTVRNLVMAGDVLVASGDDGTLRAWALDSGALRYARPIGAPVHRMAVSPDAGRIAVTGPDHDLVIVDAQDGTPRATLAWHEAQILGLAWSGATLASGDVLGHLAVWDVPSSGLSAED